MPVSYCSLASGSSGNAAFVQSDGFGLLIDCGISERLLAHRLAVIGCDWRDVHAVLLTHTHGDHVNEFALIQLRRLQIPIYCHLEHESLLLQKSLAYRDLRSAKLVHYFMADQTFPVHPLLSILPVEVPHDSDPTFAFRLNGISQSSQEWAIGHASDLGSVPARLLSAFVDLDLLALEFNHDVGMQQTSKRPAALIARVLSDHGHLSNDQAVSAVSRWIGQSPALRFLVQLHLSQECNTPQLASASVMPILQQLQPTMQLVTARQEVPSRQITLIHD